MTKREKIFSLMLMILFLSAPLFMDYVPASEELGVYFLETPGIRGLFLQIPLWLMDLGFSISASTKLYILAMNALTCIVSYTCFSKMSNGKMSALVGSICYSFSIYSVYIRYYKASMGEMAAYVLLPVCLFGMYLIYRREDAGSCCKGMLFLAGGTALLIYAHVPVAIIVLLFLVVGAILMGRKNLEKNRLCWLAGGLAGGLGMGSSVLISYLLAVGNGYFYIRDGKWFCGRALEIAELFRTITGRITAKDPAVFSMSLGVGLLAVPVCLGILCMVYPAAVPADKRKQIRSMIVLILLACVLSLRIFPWNLIASLHGAIRTGLEHIGYPHRFLIVAVLLLSLLAAFLCDAVEDWVTHKVPEYRELAMGVFVVAVIVLNVFSGIYFMNNLVYTTPMDGSFAVKDTLWLESDYLLYIGK